MLSVAITMYIVCKMTSSLMHQINLYCFGNTSNVSLGCHMADRYLDNMIAMEHTKHEAEQKVFDAKKQLDAAQRGRRGMERSNK